MKYYEVICNFQTENAKCFGIVEQGQMCELALLGNNLWGKKLVLGLGKPVGFQQWREMSSTFQAGKCTEFKGPKMRKNSAFRGVKSQFCGGFEFGDMGNKVGWVNDLNDIHVPLHSTIY